MFTPMNESQTKRLHFQDHEVQWVQGETRRGPGWHGIVEIAGKMYNVYGLNCGSEACFCDAYIVEISKASRRKSVPYIPDGRKYP
jgi:hypothetical protein